MGACHSLLRCPPSVITRAAPPFRLVVHQAAHTLNGAVHLWRNIKAVQRNASSRASDGTDGAEHEAERKQPRRRVRRRRCRRAPPPPHPVAAGAAPPPLRPRLRPRPPPPAARRGCGRATSGGCARCRALGQSWRVPGRAPATRPGRWPPAAPARAEQQVETLGDGVRRTERMAQAAEGQGGGTSRVPCRDGRHLAATNASPRPSHPTHRLVATAAHRAAACNTMAGAGKG